jgi:hypothetical protein
MAPTTFHLAGKDRPLVFSLAAIDELEEQTRGKGLAELFNRENLQRLSVKELITALWIGVKHGGEGNLSRDRVRTMLDRDLEAGHTDLRAVIEAVYGAVQKSTAFAGLIHESELAELQQSPSGNGNGDGAPRPMRSGAGELSSIPESTS